MGELIIVFVFFVMKFRTLLIIFSLVVALWLLWPSFGPPAATSHGKTEVGMIYLLGLPSFSVAKTSITRWFVSLSVLYAI